MFTSLINGKVELVPWLNMICATIFFKFGKMKVLKWLLNLCLDVPCETWYVNLFGFVFGKMRVLEWPLSWKFMKVELVPWCEIWYLNLYGCKFCKMKVLKWPLSRKRDFGLNGYKFDKWEGWTCPLIKYDMCNYFLLNSVKWKSWNDSWRENEILA